jgi:serine/threonine protein kinase
MTEAVFERKGYKITELLSAGTFKQVYKAVKIGTNELFAVKVIDLDKVTQKFKEKFLPRELAALIQVKHEHVIRIYDIFRANNKIYVFMEFASNGDVGQYLMKNKALSESLACQWFTQVCDALNYLHSNLHMAHRDIKIDNILLNDTYSAKLTDFGFAKETFGENTKSAILSETFCGTQPYYSPQLVAKKPYDPFKADVWALGVVLFAMLNNKFPFHYLDSKIMLKEQNDPKFIKSRYTKDFPKDLRNLQEIMFDANESTRISLAQVLVHPWVQRKGL